MPMPRFVILLLQFSENDIDDVAEIASHLVEFYQNRSGESEIFSLNFTMPAMWHS